MKSNSASSISTRVAITLRNGIFTAVCAALLSSCSTEPETTAVESEAVETTTVATVATPAQINCLRDKLAAKETYLIAMHKCLIDKYGASYNNVAFSLTSDNMLVSDKWIAQTPNVWGLTAEAVDKRTDIGRFMAVDIRRIIASAEHFVDITTLAPYPDEEFRQNILAGLTEVAKSGRHVTVRILAGWPPNATATSQWTRSYLNFFANPLSKIKQGNLSIYVGAQRTHAQASWNHSKIVAVDGKVFITGGENLWTNDYLGKTPVHDLNVLIYGSAAYYAHQWANEIWSGVCLYVEQYWRPWSWKSGEIMDYQYRCLSSTDFTKPAGKGNIPVLNVGRYGLYSTLAQPSDYAMLMSLRSAQKTIKLSQQDLAFSGNFYWKAGMSELGQAVERGVDVYIVLSDRDSKGGSNPYSNVTMENTADAIRDYVGNATGKSGAELNRLMCDKVHLTTLRFGTSDEWVGGGTFANHAKFIMVDDALFYVGSSNMYSSDLQEYGVFIDGPAAVGQMKADYYDELWKYSKRAAISGAGVSDCYYEQ